MLNVVGSTELGSRCSTLTVLIEVEDERYQLTKDFPNALRRGLGQIFRGACDANVAKARDDLRGLKLWCLEYLVRRLHGSWWRREGE